MHLLLAQKGSLNEADEAIDLGQSPADLVFLSAADTELSSLSAAAGELADDAPSLRLANLMQLTHPMSVDVYAQQTINSSKFVIVRVLGGESYWAYGLEKLLETARRSDIKLAVLPGDDKPDPALSAYCTVDAEVAGQIWAYLCEGGPQNSVALLRYINHLLGRGEAPAAAIPLMKAGIWSPRHGMCDLQTLQSDWQPGAPVVAISFYRALVQSGGMAPVAAMVRALAEKGLNALPVFVSSLKDPVSVEIVRGVFSQAAPSIVLNATGFAVSSPSSGFAPTVLDEGDRMVIQTVFAGCSRAVWEQSAQGLPARDLAMNVALPEVDGRVFSRAVAFKNAERFDANVEANIVVHEPDEERVAYVAELAANWIKLQAAKPSERRVAIVLANYPNRDGRLGNGVGLDTPAGTIELINALHRSGYQVADTPETGDALIETLQAGPTNAASDGRLIRETLSLEDYTEAFSCLPDPLQQEMSERWRAPEEDPFFLADQGGFALPVVRFGNLVVGIQPARGYNIDPKESYHSPDLVPPHGYFAFHVWLRRQFNAHAVVHMGKHGNLEWLPGKALSLGGTCYPEAMLGPMPNLYPFIVNDPGEGTQAKRRLSSVIVDHLTPPLTRAENYGPLRDLEALVDEYYEASGNDPRRLALLGSQILTLITDIGLDEDAGIDAGDSEVQKLEKLDGYLCELKELQIRDGLHVFGVSPEGRLRDDLICALTRVPRGLGEGSDQSLQRAIADDLGLGFDPLDCNMAATWPGPKPEVLDELSSDPWRSNGDTVERVEVLAQKLVSGAAECSPDWKNIRLVLDGIEKIVLPAVAACGEKEIAGVLDGMDGRFVMPGASGAPTRGRLDVLPTGRNFFSVDSRSVPTPTAWELGRKSADLLVKRYRQDHGEWPTSFGLSAWGTSNMRTGGDDIAQALALIGARPVWEHASRRVTGYEIITLAELGRPRIDVTLRISGFFRDAFPAQIDLFDKAIRAVGALNETEAENPIAAHMQAAAQALADKGLDPNEAERQAGYRIFGSKPGAYGAGLQALIDEKGWDRREDLADAYLAWGSYSYGTQEAGRQADEQFRERLSGIEAVIHNQDNREHDLLDSDDYYQFEGGMTAAVEALSGARPSVYHNDHSRPEKPVVRALEEEIARVVRARAANPKWISGVMRHGYKGGFEMAATLDYLFAFAATTGAVRNHHFELVHNAWIADDEVRAFLEKHNPEALKEMADRFLEAEERGLWTPKSNSARFQLEQLGS